MPVAGPAAPPEFDAVAWVRGVRDAMYEDTREMSVEELARYVKRKAGALRQKPAPGVQG